MLRYSHTYRFFISIHALLAESDIHYDNYNLHCVISIHALLAESDWKPAPWHCGARISIHALLAESDAMPPATAPTAVYFYPRSPCGERPIPPAAVCGANTFLSTLSLRRATDTMSTIYPIHGISIHALLAESDAAIGKPTLEIAYFYPRSPCGERPSFGGFEQRGIDISIHALLAESDHRSDGLWQEECTISIHALLAESD